jgi:serine/threonine-protein kinase
VADALPRQIGRYALHAEIASGGMAAVHLGRLIGPVGFARTVAIKKLHAQFAKDPAFVAMFLDEARLAARIRHPNVVPTLDVVTIDDELFLVMEYVHGDSLARLIRKARGREEDVPVEIAVSVTSHALHGLHAAHEAKSERGSPLEIVHRDVSPQNVLVGVDGIGRVLDFGIAKATSRLQVTLEGQLKGKLAYMAPEQLEQHDVDRRVDVWASAVVLWELLAGRRLFHGDHPARLMKAVLSMEIEPPSAFSKAVPAALDAVVMRGLSRDPAGRFATAREMAIALEETGLVASQAAIGAWVERIAGDSLAERADVIASIEGTSETGPSISMAKLRGDSTTDGNTLAAASTSSDFRPRRPGRALAIAATLLVLFLGAFVLLSNRATEQPEPALAAPPSMAPTPTPTAAETKVAPPPLPVVSVSASVAPPRPTITKTTQKAAPKAPSKECNPPFTIDKEGVKVWKPQCL